MGTKVSFYLRTKAEIEALTNSVDGAVYFASDSPHIYRGTGGVPHKSTFSGVYNDLSGKPITITTEQANDILTNNGKVGITTEQANAIVANTAKVGITTEQANDILTNNNKVGITTEQANAIVANTAKVGYEDSLVSALYQPDGTNPFVYTDNLGILHIDSDIAITGTVDGVDVSELKDISDYADSPMIISGGEISLGTNAGTYKINTITSLLRKTDSLTGELTYVALAEQDNQIITDINKIYYVSLNYNNGTPTISLTLTNPYAQDKRNIPIGKVLKDSANNVHYISGGYNFQDGVRKLHARAVELRSLELESGSTIAYSGTNNFTMIEGAAYGGINRYGLSSYDSAITTFVPIYQDGSDGWIEGTPRNTIDYAHYDDGSGTLATINNNKFSCHWVYKYIDDNDVYVVYGRDSYTLAEAELSTEPTRPDHLTEFGCLLGRIIAPKSGGSFAAIHMVTDNFFVGTSVSNHNQLGSLQGGILNEYYHLSNSQWVKATQIATTTQDGLMSSALVNDITANNKAIHKDKASEIFGITEKTALVDDDLFIIEDSENGNVKKKVKKSSVGSGSGGVVSNFLLQLSTNPTYNSDNTIKILKQEYISDPTKYFEQRFEYTEGVVTKIEIKDDMTSKFIQKTNLFSNGLLVKPTITDITTWTIT